MSASKGWWSSTGSSVYGAGSTAAKGVGGAFKTMTGAVASGWNKTKTTVTGAFSPGEGAVPGDKDDPTSLASLPNKLSPELYVMQGRLAEGQGQPDKALESYKKALEAEPNNVQALVAMARFYDGRNDSQQSISYFQKASAANPSDASIHNDLGLAYSKAGNAAAARDSLNKAISLDGKEVRYRNNLATVLVQNGQADEAVNQLKQVLPPAVAHYNVAYLHFSKQNFAAAQQQLQSALAIDPNLAQARELYSRLGGGQSVAGINSAYQTASNIYQSLQGAPVGNVPATQTSTPVMPALPGAVPTAQQPAWVTTPAQPSVPLPMSTTTP